MGYRTYGVFIGCNGVISPGNRWRVFYILKEISFFGPYRICENAERWPVEVG